MEGGRHLSDDTGHDQQTDAVADSVFIDLLPQPHEEHTAAGHDQDGGQSPHERQIPAGIFKLFGDHILTALVIGHNEPEITRTLNQTKYHRQITRVLRDFLSTCLPLFFQFLQRWINCAQQLQNNRCRNIGHNAEAEDGGAGQRTGAEDRYLGQEVGNRRIHVFRERSDLCLIDDRQRDLPTNAVDRQQEDRKKDLPAEFGDCEDYT